MPSGAAFAFLEDRLKTIVYIDGFNLYYAIRFSGFKWLNIAKLARNILPKEYSILRVKYYTARVSGAADPDQPRRQQIYFNALGTVPEVEIHLGNFVAKTVWRPLINLPVAERELTNEEKSFILTSGNYRVAPHINNKDPKEEIMPVGLYPTRKDKRRSKPSVLLNALRVNVHWMEEKGSDVNLASHLIRDACTNSFDAAAVLSNDSDLVEPIRIVTSELGKPVTLICPPGFSDPSSFLQKVATSVRHIRPEHLKSSLFPNPISERIFKPPSW